MKNFIKTLVIASSLFIGYNTKAQEMPKEFKGTRVQRIDANGKVLFDGSSEEYMIVKRKSKAQVAKEVAKAKALEKSVAKKNRITVLGGSGLLGLASSKSGSTVTVQERTQPVFGLSLSRMLDDRFSLSGSILSNRTFLLGLGLDFDDK